MKKTAGVYVWKYVLKGKQKEECLYVGQTRDVSQRLSSYVWTHQVRSIDDSKIGVALNFLKPRTICVYFYKFSKDDNLHKEEHEKIKELNPLLNNLGKYSKDKTALKLKNDIHKAFTNLLEYQLKKKLQNPD
jgi:excinuclease UvrABC nuclease subunit